MDANRSPIAILTLDQEEQDLCPLKMLDLKAWFQRNKEVIRQTWMQVCPELLALDLQKELRFFLIAHDFSQGFLERLACLSSFDLRVFRLRSLGVHGQHFWYAEGISPWTPCSKESSPLEAPSGVETKVLRERINLFLSRIQVIGEGLAGRGLDFEGGRFDRQVLVENEVVLELGVAQEHIWIRIPGYPDEFSLGQPEEQAEILDCFLRSLMARNHQNWAGKQIGSSESSCDWASEAPSLLEGDPTLGSFARGEGEGWDPISASTEQSIPSSHHRVLPGPGRSVGPLDRTEGSRLSDEEMAAFFGS
jgi:hypothetical protein